MIFCETAKKFFEKNNADAAQHASVVVNRMIYLNIQQSQEDFDR